LLILIIGYNRLLKNIRGPSDSVSPFFRLEFDQGLVNLPASVGKKTMNGKNPAPRTPARFLPAPNPGMMEEQAAMRRMNHLKLFFVFMFIVGGAGLVAGKAYGGFIQGTVKDSIGKEISGIYVQAFEVNFGYTSTGNGISQKTTDSAGRYSLEVLDGIYKVFFQREASISYLGQWWNGASSFSGATPVEVAGGSTVTGIDATMAIASGGILTGQVTGPNGAVVQNVIVWVYDYDQPEKSWDPLASGVTNIYGDYVINRGNFTTHLPPGNYKIRCADNNTGNNNQIEWWQGKTSFSTADPFVVTAAGANKADCKLSEGGIITGSVTDASNSPIQNASITVYDQNQSYVFSSFTDTAGTYAIKHLPSGNYKVLFKGPYGTPLAYQWYANQASFNLANWVSVAAGSTTANINAQLVTGGTITGSTTTGAPLADSRSQSVTGGIQAGSLTAGINSNVRVYDEFRKLVVSGVASADGIFSVAGLPAGKYKIEFVRYNLGSVWYNGHRTFDSADWILVNAGSTTSDVNGQLVPAAIISGKVTDTLGVAIPKVTVRVYDDATLEQLNPSAVTDSFGAYTLNSISPGGTRLYYDSHGTGYFPEWWEEKKSITEAIPINLLSGQTYPNKDAVLGLSKELYLPLILKN
jgi:hypothetical protein